MKVFDIVSCLIILIGSALTVILFLIDLPYNKKEIGTLLSCLIIGSLLATVFFQGRRLIKLNKKRTVQRD